MQYQEIDKIEDGLRKVGYALFDKKNIVCLTTGDENALIVREKVKDFEYQKGFTPAEIAFEHIMVMILEFGQYYAFDENTFNIFAKYMKEDFPEEYEELGMQQALDEWHEEEDVEMIVIGMKNKFDPQMN